jgi:hypothetical protein
MQRMGGIPSVIVTADENSFVFYKTDQVHQQVRVSKSYLKIRFYEFLSEKNPEWIVKNKNILHPIFYSTFLELCPENYPDVREYLDQKLREYCWTKHIMLYL